jgi:hypothetical protein
LGGAVALPRLAQMLGLSPRAVERDIEPHLLRTRRAIVSPRGRCLPPRPGALDGGGPTTHRVRTSGLDRPKGPRAVRYRPSSSFRIRALRRSR